MEKLMTLVQRKFIARKENGPAVEVSRLFAKF